MGREGVCLQVELFWLNFLFFSFSFLSYVRDKEMEDGL